MTASGREEGVAPFRMWHLFEGACLVLPANRRGNLKLRNSRIWQNFPHCYLFLCQIQMETTKKSLRMLTFPNDRHWFIQIRQILPWDIFASAWYFIITSVAGGGIKWCWFDGQPRTRKCSHVRETPQSHGKLSHGSELAIYASEQGTSLTDIKFEIVSSLVDL